MASADIQLNEADIPGAYLSEPFSSHTVPERYAVEVLWFQLLGRSDESPFFKREFPHSIQKSPGIVHAILTALSQPSIGRSTSCKQENTL